MSGLSSIPDQLLKRRNNERGDRARQHQLLEWLAARNLNPTLHELESERHRRAKGTTWTLLSSAEQLEALEQAAADLRSALARVRGDQS